MPEANARRFRLVRAVVVLVCAGLACWVTVAAVQRTVAEAEIDSGSVGVSIGISIAKRSRQIADFAGTRTERIGFLGDSTVVAYPRGSRLPERLYDVLHEETKRSIAVISLGWPGMSSFEYYALADVVTQVRPDQIVVPINLASFSAGWRSGWDREETMGWLAWRRLPDLLTRPFHVWGMTLDRLLLYMVLVQTDRAEQWKDLASLQVKALHALQGLRRSLNRHPTAFADGLPIAPLPYYHGNQRANPGEIRRTYGDALDGAPPDHPTLRMLAGALDEFQRGEVTILAYVVPMNVEHFEDMGFDTRTGIALTIDRVREVVESRGGLLLDLHRLLPDGAFKDLGGHFTQDETMDGARVVAEQLVPYLLERSTRPDPIGRRPVNYRDPLDRLD